MAVFHIGNARFPCQKNMLKYQGSPKASTIRRTWAGVKLRLCSV